jgi:hypothetical protein
MKFLEEFKKVMACLEKKLEASARFLKKNITPKRAAIIAGGLILLTSTLGYSIGMSLTSSEARFLTTLQKSLNSKDPLGAAKYITIENNSSQPSKENLLPFFEYIIQIPGRSKIFVEELKNPDKKNSIAVLKTQKTLTGTKYSVELKPVYIRLSTPYKGTELYMNERLLVTTDKDDYTGKIGPLVPGIYTIKAVFKNEYGEGAIEQRVMAVSGTSDIVLNMEGRMLTVESNYQDAYVYLDEENTEKQVVDFKDIGPFPGDNPIKVYVEKEFPWGLLRSTESEFTNTSRLRLDINPLTDELKEQLETAYNEFYASLFQALSTGKPDIIRNADPGLKNQMYSSLKRDSIILKDSYTIGAIDFEQGFIAVQSKGNSFAASANVTVTYKTSKNLFGIALPNSYKTESKKFKTVLTYAGEEKGWIVTEMLEN